MLLLTIRKTAAALAAVLLCGSANAADINIKYAHPTSNNSSGGQMALSFKEHVQTLSGGAISVSIFPDGQLGKLSEMNELVASGAIQMSHNTWGSLAAFLPEAGALDSPYVFKNPRQRQEVLVHPKSKVVSSLNDGLDGVNSGLHIVAPTGSSARQVTCNRKVLSPEDLSGIKFRAIPFPVFIATVKGMGAIPIPIEYSELTTALATGLADCQENPLTNIFNDKLYENQSHIMMTNHIISGGPILINKDFFSGLNAEQQGWVKAAALKAANDQLDAAAAGEVELQKKLEDLGKIFVTAEDGLQVDVFAKRVRAEMAAEFGDKYDSVLSMVEDEKNTLLN